MDYTGKTFTDETRGEMKVLHRSSDSARSYLCQDAEGVHHTLSSKYLGQYFGTSKRSVEPRELSLYDVKDQAQRYIESLDVIAQRPAAKDLIAWLSDTYTDV